MFGSDLDKALCGAFVDTDKEFLEKAQKEVNMSVHPFIHVRFNHHELAHAAGPRQAIGACRRANAQRANAL